MRKNLREAGRIISDAGPIPEKEREGRRAGRKVE